MNVYDLLKQDHRAVSQLIEQLRKTTAKKPRAAAFAKLKEAIEQHSQLEEEHFYPRLEDNEEMAELIEEAQEDHHEVAELLEELSELPNDDDDWGQMFETLASNVQEHVETEEGEIFPQAQTILSEDDAREIANLMQEAKQALRTQEA